MQPEALQQFLQENIAEADIMVSGDGRHFKLRIISDVFADKSKLERQQLIYGILGARIQQGDVHAVTMQTFTPQEWQARNV